MIDLIIPFYNNGPNLIKTLDSVNTDIFRVTVVDDGSDYYLPPNIDAAQVFRYSFNKGPGYARQFGLDRTTEPYVMFIDTGDVFISKHIQLRIESEIRNTGANRITFQYYHYNDLSKTGDNRLHGKIYKRDFLEEYGITFPLESSYLNEDIGFNRACNLIIEDKKLLQTRVEIPIIQQLRDENSLTQKNNKESLYRDQTKALSLVSIHTVDICKKNGVDPTAEINQIAISLYYWFLRTAAERPKFIEDAWAGAHIFFKQFEKEINPNNLMLGNTKVKQCLAFRDKLNFPINVLRFAHDITHYENLPSNYR